MPEQLGLDAKLNFKVGGQGGGGSWIELTNCKDVTLNLERNEADATTRANAGWEATKAALRTGSIDFDMVYDDADAGFAAIRDVFFDVEAIIGIQVFDSGGKGLQADYTVTKWTVNQPLREVIMVSVSIKIAYSATAPSWIT
jgi:hypothetical protein